MKGGTLDIIPQFTGEGRAILTASNSVQYAFEKPEYELSLYTHFLVKGLKTGEADLNKDGNISVFELHEYVEEQVTHIDDRMSPQFDNHNKGREIVLAKAALNNPLKFRKEVAEFAHDGKGELSVFAKVSLEVFRQELGIDIAEAEIIINEVLRPYQEYAKKLEVYEQALREAIAHKFPFSKVVQAHLQKCENRLILQEEDIQTIKDRILVPKQAEYEEQLRLQDAQRQEETQRLQRQQEAAERERQAAEADHLQRQQAEQLRQQQLAAERLRREQEAAELEKRKQAILAAESLKLQQQKKPPQPEFSFEVVKLKVVKERGFLGIGSGARIELEKKQGKAPYIREELGDRIFLDLVRIPAGKFIMGVSSEERQAVLENVKRHGFNVENNEKWLDSATPQHEVKVSAFWMGKYTVTNAQWFAVMETKPADQCNAKFQGEKQPVVGVSWVNCREFCERLSNKLGKNIRLPSEAEWEYACRANTTTPFHFGETITSDLVNCDGNFPYGDAPKGEYRSKTVDVDSFNPNSWGLYQMHGNVWEWCSDRWHENYKGAPQDGSSWETGTVDNLRALRGGSWYNNAINCRSANRDRNSADLRNGNIGFRLVVS